MDFYSIYQLLTIKPCGCVHQYIREWQSWMVWAYRTSLHVINHLVLAKNNFYVLKHFPSYVPPLQNQPFFYISRPANSIKYGRIRTFLLSGVFLYLEVLEHFCPTWDIFRLGGIRKFWIISSFYVSNCSNISQYIYFSQRELKHFEL